jgi:hypothetical protein
MPSRLGEVQRHLTIEVEALDAPRRNWRHRARREGKRCSPVSNGAACDTCAVSHEHKGQKEGSSRAGGVRGQGVKNKNTR